MDVEVARLSDSADIIPLMVSERLMDVKQNYAPNLGSSSHLEGGRKPGVSSPAYTRDII